MSNLKNNFRIPSLLIMGLFIFIAAAPLSWAGSLTMTTYYPAPQGSYDRITLIPQTIDTNASCTIGTIMADDSTGKLMYCQYVAGVPAWGLLNNVWAQTGNYIYPSNTTTASSTGVCTPIDFPGYVGLPICSAAPTCVPCIPDPKTGTSCPDVMLPDECYCDACEAENPGGGSSSYDQTFLGIGTSTPAFKLTLANDGGILALGTYGEGVATSNFDCTSSTHTCPTPILNWFPYKALFHAGSYDAASDLTTDDYLDEFSVAFGFITLSSSLNLGPDTATTSSGYANAVDGNYSTIAGGSNNATSADYATITGGSNNIITVNGAYSTVSGISNSAGGQYNTISGGTFHSTQDIGQTVGGGWNNDIYPSAAYSTISGGKDNIITNGTAQINGTAQYSVISGGDSNHAYGGDYNTIAGGSANETRSSYGYIGGGSGNGSSAIWDWMTSGAYSVIGGGLNNMSPGAWSVVTGGANNTASGSYSTLLAGSQNTANGTANVVLGGASNSTASGTSYSVILGGNNNTVSSSYSVAGGRYMVLGSAAQRTFAWGYSDTAVNIFTPDVFVLAPGTDGAGVANPYLSIHETSPNGILSITRNGATDSSDYFAVTSTSAASAGNIFVVKSNGYIGIGKHNPTNPLEFGPQANGAYLTAGGVWTSTSSRKFKDNIQPLDTQKAVETLKELRPVTYNYKIDKNEHHVGFIAEEVPDLIAAEGRKSIDPMNVTAILTSVLKEQEHDLQQQDAVLKSLESELQSLKTAVKK